MGHRRGDTASTRDWFHELEALGLAPAVDVLQVAAGDAWKQAEENWWDDIRVAGYKMLNKRPRGEHPGRKRRSPSPETRSLHAASMLGNQHAKGAVRDEKFRAAVRNAHLGIPLSEEQIQKAREGYLALSPERRSEITKSGWSEERSAAMSRRMRGNTHASRKKEEGEEG